MTWEAMPPLSEAKESDRLLYALDDRSAPAARRVVSATYDFSLPADRRLAFTEGVIGAALLALSSWLLAVFIGGWGSEQSTMAIAATVPLVTLVGCAALVLGLMQPNLPGQGPAPAARSIVWLLSAVAAVLFGIGVFPRQFLPLLPAAAALVALIPVLVAWRRFRPSDVPVAVDAPPGAEPLVLAAALRDQRRAGVERLSTGLGLDEDLVRQWLHRMRDDGLVLDHARLVLGPRSYSLTRSGEQWLEAFQTRTG